MRRAAIIALGIALMWPQAGSAFIWRGTFVSNNGRSTRVAADLLGWFYLEPYVPGRITCNGARCLFSGLVALRFNPDIDTSFAGTIRDRHERRACDLVGNWEAGLGGHVRLAGTYECHTGVRGSDEGIVVIDAGSFALY